MLNKNKNISSKQKIFFINNFIYFYDIRLIAFLLLNILFLKSANLFLHTPHHKHTKTEVENFSPFFDLFDIFAQFSTSSLDIEFCYL